VGGRVLERSMSLWRGSSTRSHPCSHQTSGWLIRLERPQRADRSARLGTCRRLGLIPRWGASRASARSGPAASASPRVASGPPHVRHRAGSTRNASFRAVLDRATPPKPWNATWSRYAEPATRSASAAAGTASRNAPIPAATSTTSVPTRALHRSRAGSSGGTRTRSPTPRARRCSGRERTSRRTRTPRVPRARLAAAANRPRCHRANRSRRRDAGLVRSSRRGAAGAVGARVEARGARNLRGLPRPVRRPRVPGGPIARRKPAEPAPSCERTTGQASTRSGTLTTGTACGTASSR
jgi:hypothetical protein